MNLYTITNGYNQALSNLLDDLEAGLLPEDAFNDTMDALRGELQAKAINVAAYIKNQEALAVAAKDAGKVMSDRAKKIQAKADKLKDYLLYNMQNADLSCIDSAEFTIAIKGKAQSVIIDDKDKLPTEFILTEIVQKTKINTSFVKDVLLEGKKVPGASLSSNKRLEIK